MKQGAILVNTSRGAVTDEKALADAVKNGKLALATDVYSVEPFDENHPFYEIRHLDNLLLTPHMAWGSFESRTRCICEIGKNIENFFGGNSRNRIV